MATKHTCGGPVFGKKTAGCPRCDELLAGAPPVQWAGSRNKCLSGCGARIGFYGSCDSCSNKSHFSGEKHKSGQCGPVCTFGEW